MLWVTRIAFPYLQIVTNVFPLFPVKINAAVIRLQATVLVCS
uniref:Uncharacterized protein n=1 Tax=Anguilla anguilla TaxID=7936 RepID=A0A0E9XF92_ANGAN